LLLTSQVPIQTTKFFYIFLTWTCPPPTLKKIPPPMTPRAGLRIFLFWRFWNLAIFVSGFFTDFEIVDVFQRTGLFLKRKNRQILAFFLSVKLNSENVCEPHIDIHYKSLLFWRGSVTIKVWTSIRPWRLWVKIPVWNLTQFYAKAKTVKSLKVVCTVQILRE